MFKKIFLLALTAILTGCATSDIQPEPPAALAYTVMIYMNGSDLESEFGAATDDLAEMLDSGLDSQNANVLILTGGTNRWQNSAIPETECVIWRLADGALFEQHSFGMVNMGCPDTLSEFITFCRDEFPAEKYGLIMWDHGGGAIAGFGHDEKFYDDALTLADMEKAFNEAGLAEEKLEFLGFDACFMATFEMAMLARHFARVMIASADLEPGEGWDYHFLAAFNEEICAFALGEIIVDTFFEYYETRGLADEEILTLSVIDLEKVPEVSRALGRIVPAELSPHLFREFAARRAATKTFGECSPRDNYADMVDIGDMARQLANLRPHEAKALIYALKNCVTYSRHNLGTEVHGLSAFYIYGGKSQGISSLQTYSALEADSDYTQFLHMFFEGLLLERGSESICTELAVWTPRPRPRQARNERRGQDSAATHSLEAETKVRNGIENETEIASENIFLLAALVQSPFKAEFLVPKIGGEHAIFFPVGETKTAQRFAVPAKVNGREAEIIVQFSDTWKILGARYTLPGTFPKGHDPLVAGDVIALYRLEYDFATNAERWVKTAPITLDAAPQITWHKPPEYAGFRHTDLCGNVFYTAPIRKYSHYCGLPKRA
ncbi:MAG: clostripain-related cysteine peptidase [Defluviitaleaceae bacterium]|nr:clostripain-related cysteine peptidase [Defluviitaleaceae bacterium]